MRKGWNNDVPAPSRAKVMVRKKNKTTRPMFLRKDATLEEVIVNRLISVHEKGYETHRSRKVTIIQVNR